jgi:Lysylphosphatidylglycerol synthase TM region
MAAYLAGAGLNGIIPARGGDIVKLWLVHRRIPGARYPTLAATFVPETLFETLFGFGLVIWALSRGFLPVPTSSGELPHVDVTLVIEHPFISTAVVAGVGVAGWFLYKLLRRRVSDLASRLRQGVVILRHPRQFVTGVASWQALGRVIRLGSLAAFMQAFHLPVTPETVVLVMAAQGGGRIIPLAPASAGLRLAMLSYGFVEVTGHAVDIAAITTFTFGVGALLMLAGLIVGFVALGVQLGTYSPRVALRAAREAVARHRAAASTAGA